MAFLTSPYQLQNNWATKQTISQLKPSPVLFVGSKDDDIKGIYEQVRQDDSDWYNSLSKLIGDDFGADRSVTLDPEKDADEDTDATIADDINLLGNDYDGVSTVSDVQDNLDIVDTSTVLTQADDESILDGEKINEARSDIEQIRGKETIRNLEETTAQEQKEDHKSTDEILDNAENKTQRKKTLADTFQDEATQIVQLRNKYTNQSETIASLSYFVERGYSRKEVLKLRPQVIELILEDDIPKPRRGIPDRWIRDPYDDSDDSDADWDVEIVDKISRVDRDNLFEDGTESKLEIKVKSRSATEVGSDQSQVMTGERGSEEAPVENVEVTNEIQTGGKSEQDNSPSIGKENTDSARRKRSERSPMHESYADDIYEESPRYRERQTSYASRSSYHDDEEDRSRSRYSRQQTTEQRRSRPRRRRELVIERDDDDEDNDPPPNKFWMDLPTFRDFLRTEAKLRLKILGPDWKESVLDESRWRFDLYKRWLYLLNDGVGENPLYTYGDRSSRSRVTRSARKERRYESPTRERRSPERRRRTVVSRRRDMYAEYNNDEERIGEREQRYKLDNDQDEPQRASVVGDASVASTKSEDDESLIDDDDVQVKSTPKSTNESDEKGDGQIQRSDVDNKRTRRSSNETELESRRPRRQRRSSTSPLSKRRTQEWKDFGDLEDQLLNGNIEYNYRDSQDTPRRRRRASRDFHDEY